jgi:hypothetical protein
MQITVAASLDFGTHMSGYGWTEINDRHDDPSLRQIHVCTQWPGQPFPYAKTLTALLMSDHGSVTAWGHDAHRKWREQQADGTSRGWRLARFFKLPLLARHDTVGAFTRPEILSDPESMPEDLITAYLSQLYRQALSDICRSGHRENQIRWCLTVPAQWTSAQKQVMRRAAAAAGLPDQDDRLILALEPEAAAHHARVSGVKRLADEGSPAPSLMQPGARFMVVDCGGGTVDLTAYRNDAGGQMTEIGQVSGGALGSQRLNAAFEEIILARRLGGPEEVSRLAAKCPVEFDDLLNQWEQAKTPIGAGDSRPVRLPLSAGIANRLSRAARDSLRAQQGGRTDLVLVRPAEVAEIFDQVIPHTSRA